MNNESNLVLEVWEVIRDHIPAAKRAETAVGILRAFEEYGMEARDLQDIVDEEPYLTQAYRDVYADEEDNPEADDFDEED